jgi:hypothetical protein
MYKSINDSDILPVGSTQIWYMKPDYFRKGTSGEGGVDPKDLTKTHVHLGNVYYTDLEDVFKVMQGEVWSPNGEANGLIVSKGLRHTSMSVGDVVVVGGVISQVAYCGYEEAKIVW